MYDREGKILNPTQTVKVFEFDYINKFVPNMATMGWAKVEFVDAYESAGAGNIIEIPIEQKLALKKVLTDKLEGVKPAPEPSPLEVQNRMLMERLERLEANQIPVKTPPKKPAKKSPPAKPGPAPKTPEATIAEGPTA